MDMKLAATVAVLVVLSCLVTSSMQARIGLYDGANQNNHLGDVDVNGCLTLPAWQNKKVSSVNTLGGCFVLYEHGSCNGAKVKVAVGSGDCRDHGNLNSCGFNDRATSIGNC